MHSKVHEISTSRSVFNSFIAEMRDEQIQKDRMRFRRNMERVGELLAYEISKKFEYEDRTIVSPLGEAGMSLMKNQPVIAAILRAGLPFHQGFLNYFDQADSAFVSAFRKHHKGGGFEIEVEYISCPSLTGRPLIIADPMIASGSSMVLVYNALKRFGEPSSIHIASVIASKQGIDYLLPRIGSETEIWAGAIDMELTAQAYIVPGLGDAGDLAYGDKDRG
jgi:uracil phosphoribosyltransferase